MPVMIYYVGEMAVDRKAYVWEPVGKWWYWDDKIINLLVKESSNKQFKQFVGEDVDCEWVCGACVV